MSAPLSMLSALGVCLFALPAAAQLKVAAASDLAGAFKDVGARFEKATGQKVVFSFGSTGLLARQIEEGAPFDLFAAANEAFVDKVVAVGACDVQTKARYARGHLVIWWRQGKPPTEVKSLRDLQHPGFVKIAIANPEHAPYGKAALQALTQAGLLESIKPKLVYGDNIQQTLQFAQSGNAEAALVALSLAKVSEGAYLSVDPALHAPIDQALVICAKAPEKKILATQFAAFVNSTEGRTVMRRYGFVLPGEELLTTK